jgi:NitT/TauT family transport system ATP-binding protein
VTNKKDGTEEMEQLTLAPRERTAAQIDPALEFEDVTRVFAPVAHGAKPHVALRNSTLQIADGEFVSIVGPTGCGKSTLLNIAAGLLAPSSGSVKIFGKELKGLNRQAGYMFQTDALMPWRTALGNVTAGLQFRGVDKRTREAEAMKWLARVGLAGAEDRYPHQLSGGMRKRVALAQTLILNPKILLMDEPFSALDIQTRILMENELLDLWSTDRKSVMFVTHDLGEAIALSDRIVLLSAGPGTRPIGNFHIDIPRPRDISEVQHDRRFMELHAEIWGHMKAEVLKAYSYNTSISAKPSH